MRVLSPGGMISLCDGVVPVVIVIKATAICLAVDFSGKYRIRRKVDNPPPPGRMPLGL